ncbi:LOW QUALITY PROTEIN: zinc finger B-box domain-containing protein 1 [Phyllostomus discolor]|uniref:LOW QUALITY PROTEIN: zinc finger B-box domain-containing protein 1 n=1 Tax=Phyllostomus discolor TaxID=89673 RepID=A0A6J2L3B9_9CHIR|nr:LOW QUALITY PROTEIN: zinc finger B-box domain-containing protein 1 [Phyllostomus discolor]
MNTKDFVVLPWGKPGHSVKLKYKNARELRMEKVQLELQNQEMEKKLQEFQSTKRKDKEERESSGYYWKSGKVGKLNTQSHKMSQNKGNVIKALPPGKLKLKLLKEQLQESGRPLNYKMANSSESEKPKIKGKPCGQCENKAALLVCLECGEDYCSGCFAKIHQKGALKLHRTTLLQAKSQILTNVLDVAHQFIKEINPNEPKRENHSTKEASKIQHKPQSPLLQGSISEMDVSITQKGERTNPRDRPLREGSFDEEASAQSFQGGLKEWRTGHHSKNEKQNSPAAKPDSLEECEVQTNLKIWREPLNIEFKEDSISYMEKLWLKKHRRTPLEQLQNMLPDTFIRQCTTAAETQPSQTESGEDSGAEESTVQYPVLFMPVEEVRVPRPQTAVKIVELDDTYEEELEEQGNIVPYKVELAVADSRQSCRCHDYQNAFLYEKNILQHHVFTKGKTDFLHLCLSNSSYCEDSSRAGTSNTKLDKDVDPDIYSPAVEKLGENPCFKRDFKEKSIKDMESNEKLDNSCMSFESKDSLPSVDLETPSIKEKLPQDVESLEFSNLPERPDCEDPKTMESPLSLQEIACRSKPITEQYQGLERFFVSDKNERLDSLPSHNLERGYSSIRTTIAGDRDWIPEHSVSTRADSAVALGVVRSAQSSPMGGARQRMGQTSQRPSTANLPRSNSVKRSSSCLSVFSHPPPRSAPVQSLSRATSEVSEMKHIRITDHSEPFLDSLEKESNVLKNLADPSEELYSLTAEDSPASNYNSLHTSQPALDFFKTSHAMGPRGIEEPSSSEKDTEIQSFLTLSESSTDKEEEEFLDKQLVITPPWPKSTSGSSVHCFLLFTQSKWEKVNSQ